MFIFQKICFALFSCFLYFKIRSFALLPKNFSLANPVFLIQVLNHTKSFLKD